MHYECFALFLFSTSLFSCFDDTFNICWGFPTEKGATLGFSHNNAEERNKYYEKSMAFASVM